MYIECLLCATCSTYFTEFWKESYGQAFSSCFCRCLTLDHISIGAEMVSNLFTSVFPGESTGLAYDKYLMNVWCVNSDPQWMFVNCWTELQYSRKLRIRKVKWYTQTSKPLNSGSKFKPILVPYLGTIYSDPNCQEPLPQNISLASLSTSVRRTMTDGLPSLGLCSGAHCLPIQKSGSPWCRRRNLSQFGDPHGRSDWFILFLTGERQGRALIFCDKGIVGCCVLPSLPLADKMMWQPWVLRKLIHGGIEAFSGIS